MRSLCRRSWSGLCAILVSFTCPPVYRLPVAAKAAGAAQFSVAKNVIARASPIDHLRRNQRQNESGGGEETGSDQQKTGIERAGVDLQKPDDSGADEARQIAGAVHQRDARGRRR